LGRPECRERPPRVEVEVGEGVLDRRNDSGAGREVEDDVAPGRRPQEGVDVADIALDELGPGALDEVGAPGREVVEDADLVAALGEQSHERRADEAGAAGDEDPAQRRQSVAAGKRAPRTSAPPGDACARHSG
jgi:hypothetical protein